MKILFAVVMVFLSATAHGQSLSYRVDILYSGNAESYQMETMVGTKSTVQKVTTQTDLGEINSNFGEVTTVPVERATGLTASVTPQEISKDGKVLTSLTYSVWKKGLSVAKGTHVVLLAPGSKATLPAFEGQILAITLLKK